MDENFTNKLDAKVAKKFQLNEDQNSTARSAAKEDQNALSNMRVLQRQRAKLALKKQVKRADKEFVE